MPQRLAVIARTSAMRYKGSQKRVVEIGRELGAGYILETSVRYEGARVRIATQLIQARDQTTLWTETYEYEVAGGTVAWAAEACGGAGHPASSCHDATTLDAT